jgi:hypothetical protein
MTHVPFMKINLEHETERQRPYEQGFGKASAKRLEMHYVSTFSSLVLKVMDGFQLQLHFCLGPKVDCRVSFWSSNKYNRYFKYHSYET